MFGLISYLWFTLVSVFFVLICTVFDSDIFSLLYLHLSVCFYCLFLCSRFLEVSLLCSRTSYTFMHQSYVVVRAPVFNLAKCFWVVLVKPRCIVHCELAASVLHECAIVLLFYLFCFSRKRHMYAVYAYMDPSVVSKKAWFSPTMSCLNEIQANHANRCKCCYLMYYAWCVFYKAPFECFTDWIIPSDISPHVIVFWFPHWNQSVALRNRYYDCGGI